MVPRPGTAVVVDLDAYRWRREHPAHPPPCVGICTCFGAPLGGWPS